LHYFLQLIKFSGDTPLKKLLFFVLFTLFGTFQALPQFNAKIMTYNVLNYPGTSGPERNPYFRTVISATDPDILVVGELIGMNGFVTFRDSVMKKISDDYTGGDFIDGPDTDHGIYFKSSMFEFISNVPIVTELRDISRFTIKSKTTADTLIIFGVHLKSSTGSQNAAQRAREVDSLRKVTKTLHPGANFIVLGDFNLYSANEAAYQKLTDQTQPGYFNDPLDMPGDWQDVPAYAPYHTQSPRKRSFGGGATGGLDDRFDLILMSSAVMEPGGITYIQNSYTSYGNDGNHLNDSINRPPNTAVGQVIADALHYAADHLPVFATFSFNSVVPVELTSFYGVRAEGGVSLHWATATETNNYGFGVERSKDGVKWSEKGFVPGGNNSLSPREYKFFDKSAESGKISYRLKQTDNDGTVNYSKTIEIEGSLPSGMNLQQNFPNPFNPSTKISFELPEAGRVQLKVFDIAGNEVASLIDGTMEGGTHEAEFVPTALSAGVYVYRLSWNGFSLSRKMLFLP